jgi:hypothetical protein
MTVYNPPRLVSENSNILIADTLPRPRKICAVSKVEASPNKLSRQVFLPEGSSFTQSTRLTFYLAIKLRGEIYG